MWWTHGRRDSGSLRIPLASGIDVRWDAHQLTIYVDGLAGVKLPLSAIANVRVWPTGDTCVVALGVDWEGAFTGHPSGRYESIGIPVPTEAVAHKLYSVLCEATARVGERAETAEGPDTPGEHDDDGRESEPAQMPAEAERTPDPAAHAASTVVLTMRSTPFRDHQDWIVLSSAGDDAAVLHLRQGGDG